MKTILKSLDQLEIKSFFAYGGPHRIPICKKNLTKVDPTK